MPDIALIYPLIEHAAHGIGAGLKMDRQVVQAGALMLFQIVANIPKYVHDCAISIGVEVSLCAQRRMARKMKLETTNKPMIHADELAGWRAQVAPW